MRAGKTLLLSFNQTLLRYFESFADLDGEDVDTRTYGHFARGYLKTRGRMSFAAIAEPDERLAFIATALSCLPLEEPWELALRRPLAFLAEEIKWLAQHGNSTEADYVDTKRTDRQGTRLPRAGLTFDRGSSAAEMDLAHWQKIHPNEPVAETRWQGPERG